MSPQGSEFQKKTYVERRKIEVDRFFEGIHRQHDPRDDGNYDLDWIIKNAADFSIRWRNSLCKGCLKVKECGFNLLTECNNFCEDKNKS
jgi:hypothetical protein